MTALDPSDLAGEWAVVREVLDRRTGQRGSFRGRLTVTPDGPGWAWHEAGEFTWGGQARPAGRALSVRPRPDGWWLTFADGRPFHPLRADEPLVHPCGDDVYEGRFSDVGADQLTITWDVRGPAKDQLIVSRLTR